MKSSQKTTPQSKLYRQVSSIKNSKYNKSSLLIILGMVIGIIGGTISATMIIADQLPANVVIAKTNDNNNSEIPASNNKWIMIRATDARKSSVYQTAIQSQLGLLALSADQGIALVSVSDSDDQPLDASCRYKITGKLDMSPIWTISTINWPIADEIDNSVRNHRTLTNSNIAYYDDFTFAIMIASRPTGGNWLRLPRTSGSQSTAVVVRLYQLPNFDLVDAISDQIPRIIKQDCL